MTIPKRKLLKLRKELPKNSISTIAENKDIAISTVKKILSGDLQDYHGVIELAIELRDNEKNRLESLAAKI